MPFTSLLGATPSELENIILGGVGGTAPTTLSTPVNVGTTLAGNISIAASMSTPVNVGTTLQVQPTFRTPVRVGHVFLNQSVYVSMSTPVKVATKFIAYAGALASGRWRH